MEKCIECASTKLQERVEFIAEPVGGKWIHYGSKYTFCLTCKVSWYNRQQLAEQMANRGRCL